MAVYKSYDVTNKKWLKPIFRYRIVILFGNWLNQGFLYSDKTERIFRIFVDLTFAMLLYFLFEPHIGIISGIILALISAHTLNWIFNGQIFAVYRFVEKNPNAFEGNTFEKNMEYLKGYKERVEKEKSVSCSDLYGSIVREKFNKRSDLDIRIVRKNGFINGIRSCSFGFLERSIALFNRIPLDLYVSDNIEHLSKRKADEIPVVLYDPEELLKKRYGKVIYFGDKYNEECRDRAKP